MLNKTPKANRLHIGIFGKRNAGKSSLLNALVNQEVAIVSEIAGTTTDPVEKTMEFLRSEEHTSESSHNVISRMPSSA